MTPNKKAEFKPIPNIARRAIALVNQELQNTVAEAAELVGADLKDGWELSPDASGFVRGVDPE
ncbi:hypothetical protein LCGC14_0906710 [marine sediment metagenome]|uniref:Uncharacterized protein n=1 Tax=marine sediment metagenome TaxID=412755 RepID=A0A0F9PFI6_9ZZZZ